MENEDIYKEATKKIKAKKGFFMHFIAFAFTVGLLYAIMYFESKTMLPVIIVGLSWGIGLAIHYFTAFGTEHLDFLGFSPDWEEEELEKEVDRLSRKRELREQLEEERRLLEESESLKLRAIEKRHLDRDSD